MSLFVKKKFNRRVMKLRDLLHIQGHYLDTILDQKENQFLDEIMS